MIVILIHGAWHGDWVWEGVGERLEAAGHTVLTPTMRGHFPEDDRIDILFNDYVDLVVDWIGVTDPPHEKVVLVGHSSAGMILQMVAQRVPERLAKLVFINAFVLPYGRCQFDVVPPEVAAGMVAAAQASPDLSVPIDPGFVRHALMAGETEEDIQRLLAELVPQPLALFTTPVTEENPEGLAAVEKVVIFCKDDISLPPGAYLGMAQQALGQFTLIEIEGGHETLFTHPERVADALLQAMT